MNYRHDLLRWRREQTGATYAELATRTGLSRMAVCDAVRGRNSRNDAVDPYASTIMKTFKALGLDPKYAFDFKLKERQFRRAVVVTAR